MAKNLLCSLYTTCYVFAITCHSMVMILIYLFIVAATYEDFCDIQYVHKTATNQYDPLGNRFSTRDPGKKVLTVRGRMLIPKKESKDGIEVSSSRKIPFLRILIKDTKTRLEMKKGKRYEIKTAIAILDSRPNYPRYDKSTWVDTMYSLNNGLVYQIIPRKDGFLIRINNQQKFFPYPDKYLQEPIVFVNQIGRASIFKEASLCPDKISVLMQEEDSNMSGRPSRWGFSQAFPETYIVLNCVVKGYPTLVVSWHYEGASISHDNLNYRIAERRTTSITLRTSLLSFKVTMETEGLYTCVIQNELNPRLTNSSYHRVEAIVPLLTQISEPRYRVVTKGISFDSQIVAILADSYLIYEI